MVTNSPFGTLRSPNSHPGLNTEGCTSKNVHISIIVLIESSSQGDYPGFGLELNARYAIYSGGRVWSSR